MSILNRNCENNCMVRIDLPVFNCWLLLLLLPDSCAKEKKKTKCNGLSQKHTTSQVDVIQARC